jgi:hypothetical protein
MKKSLVLALVALAVAGQTTLAHAAGSEKDNKSGAVKAAETKKAADEAAELAKGKGAGKTGVSPEVAAIARDLGKSGLSNKLTPDQKSALARLMGSSPDVLKAVESIVALKDNAETKAFNEARLLGLANLKGIPFGMEANAIAALDVKSRALQGYMTLVLTSAKVAGTKETAGWSFAKDGAGTVYTKILQDANTAIASGKTPGDALTEAVHSHLKAVKKGVEPTSKEVEDFIDQLTKFCK